MARKRKEQTAEEIFKEMYPDLPTSEPDELDVKASQQVDTSQTIAELQRQLSDMQSRVEQSQRTQLALMAQPQIDMPPQPVQFDMAKAPDPVDKPQEFAKFVMDAAQARIDYEKNVLLYQQRQGQTQATKAETLWNDFQGQYGDYTSDDRRIEIATSQVLNKARAKGIDVDKYMYGHSDAFMKDVVAVYDDLFGKPGAKAGAEVDEEEDDDDDRSTGIFGGTTSGGKAVDAEPKARPQQYGDLSQEILAFQGKTGFHR